jgi:hydroxyacylglutathione hydrolase
VGVDAEHRRVVMLEIVAAPAFSDNYIWLVHDPASGETAVVDPGDAEPALAEAKQRGWRIGQVWNTHKHWDHTNGEITLPTTVAAEKATNPFVRAASVEHFAELRRAKDNFG